MSGPVTGVPWAEAAMMKHLGLTYDQAREQAQDRRRRGGKGHARVCIVNGKRLDFGPAKRRFQEP